MGEREEGARGGGCIQISVIMRDGTEPNCFAARKQFCMPCVCVCICVRCTLCMCEGKKRREIKRVRATNLDR